MKVQKIVSLDLETAEIAQNMTNFSAFVRKSLHAHSARASVASEMILREKWARTAYTLGELCVGYAKKFDPEFDEEPEALVVRILKQTTLEEFE